tara:strand:- start:83 stop:580 length:498 start_codon:yes stop_codon:yes gene_type:complete
MALNNRRLFLILALVPFLLLFFGYYQEYVTELEPCPLCYMQRFAYILVLVTALIAAIHNPKIKTKTLLVYVSICTFFAVLGLLLAFRQIWLQSLPPGQAPACMPSFSVMLEYMPWTEVLKTSIVGTGDCAKITWTFLGLSMAAWSAFWFVALIVFNFVILLLNRK